MSSSKPLAIIAISMLLFALLLVAGGSWTLITGPTDGGANIGGGILYGFGLIVGALSFMLGIISLFVIGKDKGRRA